jgi:hypothetical protein
VIGFREHKGRTRVGRLGVLGTRVGLSGGYAQPGDVMIPGETYFLVG